jgi:hypothetical protein
MAVWTELLERDIEALDGIDLDSLSDEALQDLTVATQRLGDRLAAVSASIVARWDARGVWAGDGSRTAGARLARETSSAKRTADAALRRARALATMPATSAAGRAGVLSIDQVDLLIHANAAKRREVFVEHEQFLIDLIKDLRHRPALRALRYWCHRADAELGLDDGTAERQSEAAELRTSETLDGMVAVDGMLDPVGGAIVIGELDRIIEQLRERDAASGVDRTLPQLRAAAIVEMARRSAAMPDTARFSRPLFTVVLGDRSFEELCELANGTVITPKHIVPWMTDAMYEVVLFDGPTTVVSVSNKRLFTGALRRAVEVRDRHCQHPSGCDEPADRCDVDHIVPASRGGPTSQGNGRLECKVHNRNPSKHDHGARPRPDRRITRLDEIRSRLRWQYRRDLRARGIDPDDHDVDDIAEADTA